MAKFSRLRWNACIVAFAAGMGAPAWAQFTVEGRPVQIHGFLTQGFILSDGNNYLTTRSSDGSFAFTDGGLNVSSQITNRFRVGAQVYVRNIGKLGQGHVTLDWASIDYRFNDHFGIRAGKVKTVLGLYNDTQDLEFLHTWALLPQSLYPLDLRGLKISHLGGDVYGSLSPARLGTFSYTAYAGTMPSDRAGGVQYGLEAYGQYVRQTTGSNIGADLKWNTPVPGVLLGAAFLNSPQHLRGDNLLLPGALLKADITEHTTVLSLQYTHGPWKFDYERSVMISRTTAYAPFGPFGPPAILIPQDLRGWYTALSYRVSKRLELGAYHSRFYPNSDYRYDIQGTYLDPPARHIYDQSITARIDLRSYLDLKIEGHFIDGYGEPRSIRGFYPQDNPAGLRPTTNLLVIRLGFSH